MQESIYKFGKDLINNDNSIKKSRIIFNIGNVPEDTMVDIACQIMKDKYNIDLSLYEKKIIKRENKIGFYMNWHIDDCAVYKHNLTTDKSNNIPINDKYSLYHTNKLPKYTMIIYTTEDFTGGEFVFVDQKIKPKKSDVIFFDSREVHKVNVLREGIRNNILVKFYIF